MTDSYPYGSPQTPRPFPDLSEILNNFSGVWALMMGRPDGLRRLDVSADGFYRSFSAMLVAAPALVLSWVQYESQKGGDPDGTSSGVGAYAAHVFADGLAWVLPVIVLVLVAGRIGWGRKVSPLVVATNWSGALIAWLFAPYFVLVLVTGVNDGTALLGILLSLASLALTARLCRSVLGDWPTAIFVTIAMVGTGLVSYGVAMDITGISLM